MTKLIRWIGYALNTIGAIIFITTIALGVWELGPWASLMDFLFGNRMPLVLLMLGCFVPGSAFLAWAQQREA